MKLEEIRLNESILEKIKAALGSVKGAILGSVGQLIAVFKKKPSARLTTIGVFSTLGMKNVPSRVDTGAATCSIHATDVSIDDGKVTFKLHSGEMKTLPLLKMATVKNSNGSKDLPKVSLSYEWNGKTYQKIETKLSDRSKLKFKLLIGRNLIKELNEPVHVDPADDFGDNDDVKKKS